MPSSYPTGFDAIPLPDFTSEAPEGSLGQPARPAGEFLTDLVDAVKAVQTAVGTSTARGPLLTAQAGANVLAADSTGLVDASAAVQSWVNAVIAADGTGYAPPGNYLLNSAITASGVSDARFALKGAGPGVTNFIAAATNTAGGFLLDATGSPQSGEVHLSDFSVSTRGVGQGTGIKFAMSGGGAQHKRSIVIENVRIYGENIATDCFDIGIDVSKTYRPYLRNVTISGPWGAGVDDDFSDTSARYTATAALVIDDAYEWLVDGCHFWSASTLVRDIGTSGEAGRILNCQIVAGKIGIERYRTGQEPHFQVEGCHINTRDNCIKVDGGRILFFRGNHFYNSSLTSVAPADILLEDTSMAVITSNVFHFDGPDNRIGIDIDGTTNTRDFTIADNIFNADGVNAIRVGVGATTVTLTGNTYPGTFTKRVLDNSGSVQRLDVVTGSWELSNQDAGSAIGPYFNIKRDSASPAAADILGAVSYKGNNSVAATVEYARVSARTGNVTDGAEAATLDIYVSIAGTLTKAGVVDTPAVSGDSTSMWLLCKRAGVTVLERVALGAVDSGGTGYRTLRVPN